MNTRSNTTVCANSHLVYVHRARESTLLHGQRLIRHRDRWYPSRKEVGRLRRWWGHQVLLLVVHVTGHLAHMLVLLLL